jgi:hypothetical protein
MPGSAVIWFVVAVLAVLALAIYISHNVQVT